MGFLAESFSEKETGKMRGGCGCCWALYKLNKKKLDVNLIYALHSNVKQHFSLTARSPSMEFFC